MRLVQLFRLGVLAMSLSAIVFANSDSILDVERDDAQSNPYEASDVLSVDEFSPLPSNSCSCSTTNKDGTSDSCKTTCRPPYDTARCQVKLDSYKKKYCSCKCE